MLADFAGVIQKGTREEALLAAVAWDRLPRHVAIIMDGNGRWAAQRGQPRIVGHRAGVEAVRAAVDTGARLGIGALTLFAFSTENWKRPRFEVDALMRMLRRYLRLELDEIDRQNIRFQTIGRIGALPDKVRKEISHVPRYDERDLHDHLPPHYLHDQMHVPKTQPDAFQTAMRVVLETEIDEEEAAEFQAATEFIRITDEH